MGLLSRLVTAASQALAPPEDPTVRGYRLMTESIIATANVNVSATDNLRKISNNAVPLNQGIRFQVPGASKAEVRAGFYSIVDLSSRSTEVTLLPMYKNVIDQLAQAAQSAVEKLDKVEISEFRITFFSGAEGLNNSDALSKEFLDQNPQLRFEKSNDVVIPVAGVIGFKGQAVGPAPDTFPNFKDITFGGVNAKSWNVRNRLGSSQGFLDPNGNIIAVHEINQQAANQNVSNRFERIARVVRDCIDIDKGFAGFEAKTNTMKFDSGGHAFGYSALGGGELHDTAYRVEVLTPSNNAFTERTAEAARKRTEQGCPKPIDEDGRVFYERFLEDKSNRGIRVGNTVWRFVDVVGGSPVNPIAESTQAINKRFAYEIAVTPSWTEHGLNKKIERFPSQIKGFSAGRMWSSHDRETKRADGTVREATIAPSNRHWALIRYEAAPSEKIDPNIVELKDAVPPKMANMDQLQAKGAQDQGAVGQMGIWTPAGDGFAAIMMYNPMANAVNGTLEDRNYRFVYELAKWHQKIREHWKAKGCMDDLDIEEMHTTVQGDGNNLSATNIGDYKMVWFRLKAKGLNPERMVAAMEDVRKDARVKHISMYALHTEEIDRAAEKLEKPVTVADKLAFFASVYITASPLSAMEWNPRATVAQSLWRTARMFQKNYEWKPVKSQTTTTWAAKRRPLANEGMFEHSTIFAATKRDPAEISSIDPLITRRANKMFDIN